MVNPQLSYDLNKNMIFHNKYFDDKGGERYMNNEQKIPIVEIFVPIYIDGICTDYLISDFGRCLNIKRNEFLKGTIGSNGRRIIAIEFNGKCYRKTVARWMALSFLNLPYGNDPSKFQADHIDEDRTNDRLDNIQWITPTDNINKHYSIRMDEHIGEMNPYSVLTEDVVHSIFHDAITYGVRPSEIARKYSINRYTVQKILIGINWRHIYDQYDMSSYKPRYGAKSVISENIKNRIFDLYKSGKSVSEIYNMMIFEGIDISKSYIDKIIRKFKS